MPYRKVETLSQKICFSLHLQNRKSCCLKVTLRVRWSVSVEACMSSSTKAKWFQFIWISEYLKTLSSTTDHVAVNLLLTDQINVLKNALHKWRNWWENIWTVRRRNSVQFLCFVNNTCVRVVRKLRHFTLKCYWRFLFRSLRHFT